MMLWWRKALLELILILELEPKNFLSSTVNFLSRAKMRAPCSLKWVTMIIGGHASHIVLAATTITARCVPQLEASTLCVWRLRDVPHPRVRWSVRRTTLQFRFCRQRRMMPAVPEPWQAWTFAVSRGTCPHRAQKSPQVSSLTHVAHFPLPIDAIPATRAVQRPNGLDGSRIDESVYVAASCLGAHSRGTSNLRSTDTFATRNI